MPLQLDAVPKVLEWLRQSDGAAVLNAYVASLSGGALAGARAPERKIPDAVQPGHLEAAHLAAEGYAEIEALAAPALTTPLRHAVIELVAAGLPGVVAFILDEMWTLAEQTRARLSDVVGAPYRLLDDGWAWSIAPGRGRGWPPHRGGGTRLFDRRAPELLTVWIALGDVAADQACMHLVPLDDDPGYPDELHRLDAPLEAVRALPVREGTALAWNANVLHWGGRCSARAVAPRVSCSFSLGRADAQLLSLPLRFLEPGELGLQDRLDVIADQIAMYGEMQPDVSRGLFDWARANRLLRGRP